MSITQIQLHALSADQFSSSSVEFECECVIDQHDIIDDYNIFWITGGSAHVVIDFVEYTIQDNTFFFLHPGQIFSVASESKLKGIRLAFGENFYCPKTNRGEIGCNGILFNNLISTPILNVDQKHTAKFKTLLDNIIEGLGRGFSAKQEFLESYLRILLIECTEYKKNQVDQVTEETSTAHETIRRFNQLVEENYSRWHKISPYAEKFAISSKSLTKKLSKLGVSPRDTIHKRIIIQAKRLLYFTSKQIKEIAAELGFDDPSHFSAFFKNKTNHYPLDFRKKA